MFPVPIFRHVFARHREAHQEALRQLTWARVSKRWKGAW